MSTSAIYNTMVFARPTMSDTLPNSNAPRSFQSEVAESSIGGNVISVAAAGSGNTLISILLLKDMVARAREEAAQKGLRHKMALFVVNKVSLVFQQHAYIISNSDIKAEALCGGMNAHTYGRETWDAIFERTEVVVLTGQMLKNIFQDRVLKINDCHLIIFDECHYATKKHCYRQILRDYYWAEKALLRPKIFGMTASFPKDKGSGLLDATELELIMDAKIITAPYDPMCLFKQEPLERIVWYDDAKDAFSGSSYGNSSGLTLTQERACAQLLSLCVLEDKLKPALRAFEYAQVHLGAWCAAMIWKYALRELRDDIWNGDGSKFEGCLQRLQEAESIAVAVQPTPLDSEMTLVKDKIRQLVRILQEQLMRPGEFRGIIVVERLPTAHVLQEFLEAYKTFRSEFGLSNLRPAVLTRRGNNGDVIEQQTRLEEQRKLLESFRKGEFNLLLAMGVAEESLDIGAYRLVIRFDNRNTITSHIQSRRRIQGPDLEYIVMQPIGTPSHLDLIKEKEADMRRWCAKISKDSFVNLGASGPGDEEEPGNQTESTVIRDAVESNAVYVVPSTGVRMTPKSAVSTIYQYCYSLPCDNYSKSVPKFDYRPLNLTGAWHCWLYLPSGTPLSGVYSGVYATKEAAKCAASFIACKELHSLGALTDHLVPHDKTNRLADLNDPEDDEDSDPLGGPGMKRPLENTGKRSNKYAVHLPVFWNDEIIPPQPPRPPFDRIQVYMTVFALRPPPLEEGMDMYEDSTQYRALGLLTVNKLPQFDPIEVCPKTVPHWVNLTVLSQPMDLTTNELVKLNRYQHILYEFVIRNPVRMGTPKTGVRHLTVPLSFTADLASQVDEYAEPYGLIDWQEIEDTLYADAARSVCESDLDWDILRDKVLYEANLPDRLYSPIALRKDLNAGSRIPPTDPTSREGQQVGMIFEKFSRTCNQQKVKNYQWPIIEVEFIARLEDVLHFKYSSPKYVRPVVARFLFPELTMIYPVTATVYRSASWMSTLLLRVDALLKVQECQWDLQLTDISPSLMLEALTTSEVGWTMNYQRLELLGDTVLKFLISVDLYIRFPIADEALLDIRRRARVTNARLCKFARRLRIDRYINKRFALNPHFYEYSRVFSEEMMISNKTMADFMESILGAAYVSGGMELGLRALVRLIGPLEGIEEWSDFSRTYSERATMLPVDDSPFQSTSAFGDLSQLEKTLGYQFKNLRLLKEALTHVSCARPETMSNQRLEHLGEGVIDMLIVDHWVREYPKSEPSELHMLKMASISKSALGAFAIQMRLHAHISHMNIILAVDIDRAVAKIRDAFETVRGTQAGEPLGEYWYDFSIPSVMSRTLVSVLAAVMIDAGWDYSAPKKVFERCILPMLQKHVILENLKKHPLTKLIRGGKSQGCRKVTVRNVSQRLVRKRAADGTPVDYSDASLPPAQKARPTTSSTSVFWDVPKQGTMGVSYIPLQVGVVLVHDQELVRVTSNSLRNARRDAAKAMLDMMEKDPFLLARHCKCAAVPSKKLKLSDTVRLWDSD